MRAALPREATPIQLSSQGLANIQMPDDDPFVFLVEGISHPCPRFVAQFLSPRISRLHCTDFTLSELEISIPNGGVVFEKLLSLGTGGFLSVSAREAGTFLSLCDALENSELGDLIRCHFFGPEPLTVRKLL
jgi:hypothetical protein